MTTPELLPLPRWMETYRIPGDDFHTGPDQYLSERMQAYARANVEHHTAALQAEVEAMRAEMDALREALETMVEMVEMNGFGRAYAMDVARSALAQEQGEKHDNQD